MPDQPAHPLVVPIRTSKSSGTGVYIAPDLVLTCQHVIGNSRQPIVDQHKAEEVVARDPTADLALLRVNHPAPAAAPLNWLTRVDPGVTLALHGFPPHQPACRIRAQVRAEHSGRSGIYQIQLDAGAHPGMSGGLAVLDSDPLAAAGITSLGGDNAAWSGIIGIGPIRDFLAAHGIRLPSHDPADPTPDYFRRLRDATGTIHLRGLKIESAHSVPMEEIYIPLSGSYSGADPEKMTRRDYFRSNNADLELTLRLQRVLIQGEAGSGKSTFLRRVAYELAGGAPGAFPKLPKSGWFPLFARIASFEKHMAECGQKHLPSPTTDSPLWLPHYLAAEWQLPQPFIEHHLASPQTLVLLDGLDESPNPETRLATMRLIERIATQWPKCRFAVTTRPRAGASLRGFEHSEIQPLSGESRAKFVADWCRHLYRQESADQAEKHRQALSDALAARPEIGDLSGNALMLTCLAALHWNRKRLPEQRADLYAAILEWLATSRQHRTVNATDCLDYLGALAWGMQTQPAGRVESIDKRDAADLISGIPASQAREFLDREQIDSGIVIDNSGAVKFWHLTFQEFLAARHLDRNIDNPDSAPLTEARAFLPEWREVTLLYCGIRSKLRVSQFIAKLLDRTPLDAPLAGRARCAALIAPIASDLRPSGFTVADERWHPLLHTLTELWTAEAPEIDLPLKVAAAEALDELHPHPMLRLPSDPDYWVPVPGGDYRLGNTKSDDPEAYDDETPRDASLTPFEIGRCPVTVHEFRPYVAATGDAPRYWEHQSTRPSRPVVYVDWEQARRYCLWLRDTGAGEVSLASEDQWEAAARGKERREYPWGNKPEPSPALANYDDARIGHPSPVGLFPKGSTPTSIHDLAGNVWEWTSTDYSAQSKTVRGGAFLGSAGWLRAAGRYGYRPVSRFGGLGFRLVRE